MWRGLALGMCGVGLAVSCSPVPEVNLGYTPSEYRAVESSSSQYRRDVEGKGVYESLYENPDAIRHYCGAVEAVADVNAWSAACERKLERVYWARVKSQYKYADLQEATDYCDLKPERCATPKGFDEAIRSSHISGAQRQNYVRDQEIEGERAARIQAEEAAREKFLKAMECTTRALGDEAAGAECRGQRVVRCKARMRVVGSSTHYRYSSQYSASGSAEEVCIESGGPQMEEAPLAAE